MGDGCEAVVTTARAECALNENLDRFKKAQHKKHAASVFSASFTSQRKIHMVIQAPVVPESLTDFVILFFFYSKMALATERRSLSSLSL